MSDKPKESIYRKLHERPGHYVGLARSVEPFGIIMVCTCGHDDVWQPFESPNVVGRRWNQHLPSTQKHPNRPRKQRRSS